MAVSLVTDQIWPRGFVCNANSADFSGTEELVAAVAEKSICIERVLVSCGAAITVTLLAGAEILLGPLYLAANENLTIFFRRILQLPAATALNVSASGAGNATLVIQGLIR